jgi:hypothetical protein
LEPGILFSTNKLILFSSIIFSHYFLPRVVFIAIPKAVWSLTLDTHINLTILGLKK